MKYEYEQFELGENEEIVRLLRKHDIRMCQILFRNHPKIIGFEERNGNSTKVCSLWRMNYRHGSIRKTKKAIKKFLRNYDKQNK